MSKPSSSPFDCGASPPPGRGLPLYLLAGGRSSRFGSDKARAHYGEQPVIVAVARSLAAATGRVTVVAERADKYADLGLATIADRRQEGGPAAGLEAALAHERADDWLVVSSCDLLGLRAEWIDRLAAARRPGAQLVAFRGQRWQPLPALVHRSLRQVVTAALDEGCRALWRIIERADHVALPLPERWSTVVDVNDRESLRQAQEALPRPRRPAGRTDRSC